jgi:hypothetical protein
LFFSLTLARPHRANDWAARLTTLGRKEAHFNLRAIISETIHFAASQNVNLDREVLSVARSLKSPGIIRVARDHVVVPGADSEVRYPPYLAWVEEILSGAGPPGELKLRTRAVLEALYPNPERGIGREMEVHRAHNINTNFDAIEISGGYDRAVRSAINRAVQELIEGGLVREPVLTRAED